MKVMALGGFMVAGHGDVGRGDIIDVPKMEAMRLIGTGQAVAYGEPEDRPEPVTRAAGSPLVEGASAAAEEEDEEPVKPRRKRRSDK